MPRAIEVVGAVVVRHGLILCAQRGLSGTLPGLWEFPGGKIEPAESPTHALERELREELEVEVQVGDFVARTTHSYPFGDVVLSTYYCELLSPDVSPTQHEALVWLPPEDLFSLEWAPADIPAVHEVAASVGPHAAKPESPRSIDGEWQ